MAIDIRPDDEIITSPYTFFASVGSIARLGARPVFVDIDPLTYNLDPTRIEAAITLRTRAIIPIHLFGQIADMDPVLEDCRSSESFSDRRCRAGNRRGVQRQTSGLAWAFGVVFSFFHLKISAGTVMAGW